MKNSPSILAPIFVAISIFCTLISGCSAKGHIIKAHETKTVAMLPFASPSGGTAGQEAADWLALKLIEKGYVVIDRSRTTALINEKKFYDLGMTDEVRNVLQGQQLDGLVFGQVSQFDCDTKRQPTILGNLATRNRCTIALTAKMADPATGKLLWGLILKDSAEAAGLTANDLMRSLIGKADVAETFPLGNVEKPAEVEVNPKPAGQP